MSISANPPNSPVLRTRLASFGLIEVSGSDARSFLHNQLSNDLLHLAPDQAQWTAYCSPKGRMLAGFLAWCATPERIYLACDRALVPGLVKRLRMFVLRAKAVIDDASERFEFSGVIGEAGDHVPLRLALTDDAMRIDLPAVDGQRRALIVAPVPAPAAAASAVSGDETVWKAMMIAAGEVWLTPATQDQFVPQMVNFDAIGGISFKKGCYPGQEVVARAHYRGAVKRRMYPARVKGTASAGQPLFAGGADAQECGMIANASVLADGFCAVLAVVPIQSRLEANIHLAAVDGPALVFLDLPYAIPESP